jgi:hypothetical protein
MRSFAVAGQHLDQLGQLVDALDNGNMQLVNKIGNAVLAADRQSGRDQLRRRQGGREQGSVKAIVAGGGGVGPSARNLSKLMAKRQEPGAVEGRHQAVPQPDGGAARRSADATTMQPACPIRPAELQRGQRLVAHFGGSSGDKATDLIKGDRGPSITGLVTGKQPLSRNEERRKSMDDALTSMGAQPDSLMYKGGKLVTEVAGSAGAGGAVANGARVLGAAPELVTAISSGGFSGGGNLLARAVGGSINGAATAGLVNPEEAGTGAVVGGLLPGGVKVAGKVGNALSDASGWVSKKLMQSAIKPTLAQRQSGDAATAIDTLLQYGISPTKGGVNKLRELIDGLNDQIATKIGNSTATVNKGKVLDRLDDARSQFGTQVRPQKDLSAIEEVGNDFASHPSYPLPQTEIPVQQAQELKQGTYRVLSKKYGEAGSAETEAQKHLARGLKEEIAAAVPGVESLNAQESKLLTTLDVAERRALLEMNKNPVGLASLAKNPLAAAGFMADRSAAFKAIAARLINNAAVPAAGYAGQKAIAGAGNPLLRASGLVATEANP